MRPAFVATLAIAALACSEVSSEPGAPDSSVDGTPAALRDVAHDLDVPHEAAIDVKPTADASTSSEDVAKDAYRPPKDGKGGDDARADRPHAGEIDAAWRDVEFGVCTALPPLPQGKSGEASLWFSASQIVGASRARARNDIIYGAANPPFRLDAQALSLCLLPGPTESGETTQDILAPAGSSLVVMALGKNGPRTLRVSADDGRTWSTARGPGIPPGAGHSLPCALAAPPSKTGPPTRLFATYGGNTLDVSDNGGLDWTRVIDGSSNSVAGFVTDSAGETLWYVSEVVLDGVAALWLPLPVSGPLPPAWNVKRLEEWDANGVYSAVADPFDPHAIYLGGEGRLGYLTTLNGDLKVDIRWARSSTDPSQPYTYVLGLWADPSLANHVIWGGGQQGGGPAQVLESMEGGRNAHEIPLEGLPEGSATAIGYLPGMAKLVIFMQRWSDATLAVYVIDR